VVNRNKQRDGKVPRDGEGGDQIHRFSGTGGIELGNCRRGCTGSQRANRRVSDGEKGEQGEAVKVIYIEKRYCGARHGTRCERKRIKGGQTGKRG